jgi:hypothetical protein
MLNTFLVNGTEIEERKDLNVQTEAGSASLVKKIGGTGLSLVPMVVAGVLGYLAKKEYKEESFKKVILQTEKKFTILAEEGRIMPLQEADLSSFRTRDKYFNALDFRNSMLVSEGYDFKGSCEVTIEGAGKISITKLLHQETQRPDKKVNYDFGGTSIEKSTSWNKRFTIAVAVASACLIGAGIIGLIAVWKDDIAYYFSKDNSAQPTVTQKGI